VCSLLRSDATQASRFRAGSWSQSLYKFSFVELEFVSVLICGMKNPLPNSDTHKYPRLYLDADFVHGSNVELEAGQNHYLRNVLRKQEGDFLRVFNGRDGEWLARILKLGKKLGEAVLDICVRDQPEAGVRREVHLYFSPIKKQRMDMLVEKAVELGVSALHPVITHRTVSRKINEERIRAQIIEAAEQCERMDVAELYPALGFGEVLAGIEAPLYACIERSDDALPIAKCELSGRVAFLIGPEGGFDEAEIMQLRACEKVVPISLGDTILRAETAAIACLSWTLF